jgi:hypothetical protein
VRRERLACFILAVLLILVRSFLATWYEGFFFDADQAIVGLMAKHASDLRAFPLHYYGQNYLLGVQAWIIAPFFWIARPSVAVMRAPLILLNIAVGLWLIERLRRAIGLAPYVALVAALPLLMPTPAVGTELLDASGASIEVLVYVALLWELRRRPLAWGAVLGVAVLHREFLIVAAPALALAEAVAGERPWRDWRRLGWMAAGFALVWLVVDDLKMHLTGVTQSMQMASLGNQVCLDGESGSRVAALVREALPTVFGGRPMLPQWFRMSSPVPVGWAPVGWLVGVLGAVMAGAGVRPQTGGSDARLGSDPGLPAYLVATGAFAAAIYPLSCNVALGYPPLLRYLLLELLIPVGLFAAFARRRPARALFRAVTAGIVLWTAVNLWDTARVVGYALRNPPASEHRAVTEYLLSHQIRYATAIYWDAYVIDFLSRERVTVASSDTFRIPDYQRAVEAHRPDVVHLERLPCTGFATVASWCLQR